MNVRSYSGNDKSVTISNCEDITAEECFKLALCGKDAWNEWRAEFHSILDGEDYKNNAIFDGRFFDTYPDNAINFSGFNFDDGVSFIGVSFINANFQEATFGKDVTFEKVKFSGKVCFQKAIFLHDIYLDELKFLGDVYFNDAIFCGAASFKATIFEKTVFFNDTTFKKTVTFERAEFLHAASFSSTKFLFNDENAVNKPDVDFSNTKFNHIDFLGNTIFLGEISFSGFVVIKFNCEHQKFKNKVSFENSFFGDGIFKNVVFGKEVNFQGACFKKGDFSKAKFKSLVDFSGRGVVNSDENEKLKEFTKKINYGYNRSEFETLIFTSADFFGEAIFNSRKFKNTTLFNKVTFHKNAPKFHSSELHQDISFDQISFRGYGADNEAECRAYRTLKLIMSKHQAVHEEQLFFRYEMRAEVRKYWEGKGIQSKSKWFLYKMYELSSDYGSSLIRPILGYFMVFLFFCFIVFPLTVLEKTGNNCFLLCQNCYFEENFFTYALAQSIPFFDVAKLSKIVAIGAALGSWEIPLLVVYKGLCIGFIFLIGLALRNNFKLK